MNRIEDLRQTLRLAGPIAASQVSDMLTLTADAVMVGALGSEALAAVTLAGSSTTPVMLFAVGFTVAMSAPAAAAWELRHTGRVADVFRTGRRISLWITLALVVLLLAASPFLHVLGSPQHVTELAIPYLRWYVASFFFRIWFGTYKQTIEAMGNTRLPMVIALTANVSNVLMNVVFIYGWGGIPAMGVEGAGIATFLSRVLSVALIALAWKRLSFVAEIRTAPAENDPELRRVLISTGASIGSQITIEVLAFAGGAIMMGWLGASALAAHQVAINLASITFMVALAIGTAATYRMAAAQASADRVRMRMVGTSALGLIIGFEILTATIFIALRHVMPTWYISDPQVITMASQLLILAAAFQIFDGVQAVGLGILRGLHDTVIPTRIVMVSYLIVALPLSYLLGFHTPLGATGIWLGYVAGLIFSSTGFVLRFLAVTKQPTS
ncbi:MAG: MATE family efflux transporter [Candidatus Kapabacteria bacterium]|nr:MATE family efflux transporter [Candidatus Kapabacteria bacterium]